MLNFGLGGDAWTAPAETQIAYWAALAAGADGLVLQVRRSAAGELRCVPASVSEAAGPLDYERFDAGAGSPWAGGESRPALRHPRLNEVLRNFGRRTSIVVHTSDPTAIQPLQELLETLGLIARIPVIAPRNVLAQGSRLRWIAELEPDTIAEASGYGAHGIAVHWASPEQLKRALQQARESGQPLWVLPPSGTTSLPTAAAEALRDAPVAGVASADPLQLVAASRAHFPVFRDSLQSQRLDREAWAAGYSQPNSETSLEPRPEGFTIVISRGREYSGGGLVTRFSVSGPFEASVDFLATRLQQASTFELAAIGIDPGLGELDARKLTGTNVHLGFDVHGAPPYASSESDENDGYRFGWNNSSNLTRISPEWLHASGNMYNKYGRDVGPGPERKGPWSGSLRLRRCGAIFASYFRDEKHPTWICSGAGPVAALPEEAFIRLAAKHWHKGGEPPATQIRFSNFVLTQP